MSEEERGRQLRLWPDLMELEDKRAALRREQTLRLVERAREARQVRFEWRHEAGRGQQGGAAAREEGNGVSVGRAQETTEVVGGRHGPGGRLEAGDERRDGWVLNLGFLVQKKQREYWLGDVLEDRRMMRALGYGRCRLEATTAGQLFNGLLMRPKLWFWGAVAWIASKFHMS